MERPSEMWACNFLRTKHFHGVSSGNQHPYWLKSRYGKVSKVRLVICCVSLNHRILLANSNQWYFNKLVKIPCHKTPYRCPHRLNLSSQSSLSCAGPNIKVLKDKGLEFASSIYPEQTPYQGANVVWLVYGPAWNVKAWWSC